MLKILIAEDEVTTRKLLANATNDLGLVSLEASNGRTALNFLCDNPDISLLVTDIAMPEMDGRELIAAARQHPAFADLPIIIVSGIVSLNQINEILIAGAWRFMPKPIDLRMFRDYLRLFLKIREFPNVDEVIR